MHRKNFNKSKRFKRSRRPKQDYFIPGVLGIKVLDGDVDLALKKLKKELKEAGTMQTLKEKRYFEKKSSKRRKLIDNAVRKQQYREKLERAFWKDYCWLVPPNGKIGPNLPE